MTQVASKGNLVWSLGNVGSATSGVVTGVLDAAEELVCNCITVPKSGTVKKIGFRVTSRSAGDAIFRATLETVASAVGLPVSTTYAGRTLYVANAESADITVPAAAGVIWAALNGTTGVSVTAGDKLSIVVRCVTRSSGSITVGYAIYGGYYSQYNQFPYVYTYLNTTSTANVYSCNMSLEYSDEICMIVGGLPAATYAIVSWDSADDPTFRGLRFQVPFKCSIIGIIWPLLDTDYNINVHAYTNDDYTEFADFPMAIDKNQRKADIAGLHQVIFKTAMAVEANTTYRIALEPTESGAGAVSYYVMSVDDDAASGLVAMNAMPGGNAGAYLSTINDAPTSGTHTWTDTITSRPICALIINQVDDGAGTGGSGGGLPILGNSVVR